MIQYSNVSKMSMCQWKPTVLAHFPAPAEKPSAIMVLRILLLIVASAAEDDEACITNSVLTTNTCWRYDCGCSAAPDVRPIFLASCCRLDYISATHGQRDASGMLAWQTEFASHFPRSSRTHLVISHGRSLHNFKGINWGRRMKASRLLLSTSPDLSFKNRCRSLSVLSYVVAAASKEMHEPMVNVTETVGRGWLVHLWRARDVGEKLCNSAAHAQPNSFRTKRY